MLKHSLRGILLLATVVLGACATVPIEPGAWQLHAPGGKPYTVDVTLLRKNEYYLRAPGTPLSGVYSPEKKGELRIVRPDNPRMDGYVWKINTTRSMVLAEEPAMKLTGQRLVSSEMTREGP